MSKKIYLSVLLLAIITSMLATLLVPNTQVMAANETVNIWITSADRSRLLQQQANVTFGPDTGSASYTVDVNEGITYQSMDGFGASITDSSAALLYSLPAAQRDQVMVSLFDPVNGIGMSFLRQPMGASDFVDEPHYTYNDRPAGQTDYTMANFSIAHDNAQIIPLLQRARQLNPNLKVMASPWSPPAWMKTTGSLIGGRLKTDSATLNAYALYFVKFIQAYQAAGIPIYAVTPQNEPQNRTPNAYPGTDMPVADQNAFINVLGPALQNAGLGHVKIISYDHNWTLHPDDAADAAAMGVNPEPNYPFDALNASAAQYIAGTGFHMYSGDANRQNEIHNAFPNKDVWFTEGSGWHGAADTYAKYFSDTMLWHARYFFIASTRAWGKGVINWNLALNSQGGPANGGCILDATRATNPGYCTGVVAIDGTTVTRNAEYYTIGHFSKFVQQGAVRIESNNHSGSMENVAFRNPDGSKVLVVLNATTSANTIKVRWGGQSYIYTVPASSLATFKWGACVGCPTPTPTPPALSRTGWVASASVSGSDVPANALDGNLSTRWSTGVAQANGQWFQVDMLSNRTFSQITMDAAASSGDYPRGYQVFVSTNGTSWGTAVATGTGTTPLIAVSFPTQTARYIRVVQTGSVGNWWAIHEFNVYGSAGTSPTATRTNTPAGPTATRTRTATPGGPTATNTPVAPTNTPAAGGVVNVWVTTGDRSKLLQQEPNVSFAADSGSNPTTIDVNEATTYQTMDGFGAAMTDSSAWLIWNRLSASQRSTLMNNLFGPNGARLSFVRLPMSSTDFSIGNYTYDQTCCDVNDFSISHDNAYVIPVLQQAKGIYSGLRIIGSPWTAPTWMKNTGAWGNGTLLTNYYGAYAQYFVKFAQAYQAAGLPIYAVTLQNEPHHEPGTYPGMRMEPVEQANFVKNNLGPSFSSAGLSTRIVVWDHNWDEPNYPINVLNDAAAKAYIYGSAFHCYAGAVGNQNQVHDAHPTKAILFTECSGGAWATNFGDNLKWNMQNIIIGSTRAWSTSALLWNMALDTAAGPQNGGCTNCRGVVTIDQANGNVTYNEEYYILGHASRFVDPGAVRIASNTFAGGIENVAFRNPDGSKALVVINMGTAANTFKVRMAGQSFTYTLPAGAAATFKWSGSGGTGPTATPTRTNTPGGPTLTPTRTATPGPTATRTPTSAPVTYYRVTARHSGKCLDVSGNSTGDGAWMQQWTCGSGLNQNFQFVPVSGTSYYQIIARHSGKCLDVQNNSTADGALIQQWACGTGLNQQFSLQTVSGTSYIRIIARSSSKCLDVQNVSTADGAWITQWACGTGLNQQWSRTVVP